MSPKLTFEETDAVPPTHKSQHTATDLPHDNQELIFIPDPTLADPDTLKVELVHSEPHIVKPDCR